MVVTMQSSNLSSLLPRITVYDGNKQNPTDVIGSNYGDTVSVTRAVSPGTWYIRAMAGTSGPAGAGAYGLQVNFGSSPQAPIAPPDTAVAAQPDQGPTTYPMGTGWMIGGQFVPFLGDLPAQLIGDLVDGLHRITVGTLSGYGDVMEVGAPAGHGHRHGGGAGDMQHGGPHRDRDAPPPGVPSGATIIDPAANLGADDSRGAIATGPQRRSEAPRRAEAARPGAVDVALAGWGPDSLPGGRARFVRWRPAESGPIRPLSLGHDGDRRMIAHARPPKPSAMVPP
jgi:hypothetical protein